MAVLKAILLHIWNFFGKNKDQITAISQTALVIGGVLGLYKYISDDRQHRHDVIAKVSETWIENSDALAEIDNRWISIVSQLNQMLQPLQEIPGLAAKETAVPMRSMDTAEDIKRKKELEDKIGSLPIILNKCLEKDECDEVHLANQFCSHIYKLGMIYDFKSFSNDLIASVIKNQLDKLKKMGDKQPLTQSNVVNELSAAISTLLDPSPNNTALRDLIGRCNSNTDQATLYKWYFDAAFHDQPKATKPKQELLNVKYSELAPAD